MFLRIFIINFKHTSHFFLVFLLFTLIRWMFAGSFLNLIFFIRRFNSKSIRINPIWLYENTFSIPYYLPERLPEYSTFFHSLDPKTDFPGPILKRKPLFYSLILFLNRFCTMHAYIFAKSLKKKKNYLQKNLIATTSSETATWGVQQKCVLS